MHVDHVNNVMATLQFDSHRQFLKLGLDPRDSKFFFLCLSAEQVLML